MSSSNPLNVPPAWLEPVTLTLQGNCPGYALSHVSVRGHRVAIDEPPERDGTDQGPAPTEMMVAALIGVTNVILRRMARRDGLAIRHLEVDVAAELDRRGVWLVQSVGNPWRRITSTLRVSTPADETQWRRWQVELPAFSPLHAMLHAAGTEMIEHWHRA